MKRLSRLLIVAALALLPAQSAFANAFFIQEMSGSGMAQAGAVVASGDRPSGLFQNAANLAFIPGLNFEFAGTVYAPKGYLKDYQGVKTDVATPAIFTPHAFVSAKITDWLTFGFGEFVDFGLAVKWPKDWPANYIVTNASMTSFTLNPNLAFGPWKGFAFAAGFDAKYGSIVLERALTFGDQDGQMRLGGSAWGYGFNVGAMYQPASWVRLGAAYRSSIRMNLDNGKVDFTVPTAFASRFPDQKFKSHLTLPNLVSGGARFWVIQKEDQELSIELDGWATLWSSYDKLTFKFNKGLGGYPNVNGEPNPYAVLSQSVFSDYQDTAQVRLGGEYKFFRKHLAARLGFLWDGNPAPSDTVTPMLPDSDRIMPTVGFGATWYGVYVDVAYMPVINVPRNVTDTRNPYPAKYRTVTHDFTFSLGFAYDYFTKEKQLPPVADQPSEPRLQTYPVPHGDKPPVPVAPAPAVPTAPAPIAPAAQPA